MIHARANHKDTGLNAKFVEVVLCNIIIRCQIFSGLIFELTHSVSKTGPLPVDTDAVDHRLGTVVER